MRKAFAAVLLTLFGVAVPAGRLLASPQDSKVGQTRVTYSKTGTVLRKEMDSASAAVATLPAKTSVSILDVKLPWIQVTATLAGKDPATGWLRAYETVEP